ncbi:hypothetical protein [Phenylobacterium sp. J367]|uniref:alginate O-acetyltransferase AlgX-related protein n=1 Tax=Phenylobacterium sp. J367 TaxID=2898435 RepID=UPI002150A878|nr:hypothetical protein [Phenylobacterium sp. J367]MCR5877642.1 hypothetical protein [Phenylobacterium sp. J367]
MTDSIPATLAEIRALDAELDAAAGPGHPVSALKAGALSPHGVAVAGTDGYLFIGNGANRWERQFLGELAIDDTWFRAWSKVLDARAAEAERRGKPLWNLVVPEKQVVYGDKRWPEGADGGKRPVRQMLDRLKPANFTYPEAALAAARERAPAYFRHNSHWTPSGCCAAVAALLGEMGIAVDVETLGFAYRRVDGPHDLSVHFFEPAPAEQAAFLAPPGEVLFDNRHLETTGKHAGSIYGLGNPAAPDSRTLILFGDSFAYDAGLTPALSAVFAKVVFVWSKNVVWDLVDQHAADLVLWESAERFIATPSQA